MNSMPTYRAIPALAVLVLSGHLVCAASRGHLKGLVQSESGQPLADILITLIKKSSLPALPVLARSDQWGELLLQDIEAGDYELQVRSTSYRSRQNPSIAVKPGETAFITLVLQQLFSFEGSDGENLTLKTLFRTASERRLIFRQLPGTVEDAASGPRFRHPFENAVFQVYSNAGLGGDYLIFPGDSSGGATTNFAFTDSLGNSRYIFAGQLNSGEDSLWRLKNFVSYQLNDHHALQLFLGYGRMSFDQPSLALLGNPIAIGDNLNFIGALGTMNLLSVGFQDRVNWGDLVAVVWGLELNQVRTGRSYSFANPHGEVSFSPTRGTTLRALATSKRATQGNTLQLPEGDLINLADSVYFSRVGHQFSLGTSRHHQGSVAQKLGATTEVEVAAYQNRLFGGTVPLLAVFERIPGVKVLQLDDEQADNRGYRVTVRQQLGENVKTSVSYIRSSAMGVAPDHGGLVSFNEANLRSVINRYSYHAFSTHVEAFIPPSQTRLTALVKLVPNGNPITTLDTLNDIYETSNKGVNLFIRQIIPVPPALLSFFGLDFLAAYKFEALLDIRNLTNEDIGLLRTALGDVLLVRNPRTLRGGISLNF